jgi:hypothetical protein
VSFPGERTNANTETLVEKIKEIVNFDMMCKDLRRVKNRKVKQPYCDEKTSGRTRLLGIWDAKQRR